MNNAVKFLLPMLFVVLLSPLTASTVCIPENLNGSTLQGIEPCIPQFYAAQAGRIVDGKAGRDHIVPVMGRDIVDRVVGD